LASALTRLVGLLGCPGESRPHRVGPMELLDKAVQLGVRVVQVIDNLPLLGRPKGELLRFRQRADELSIQLEMGTSGISPEHLAEYLSLAQLLGSRIVRVLTDTAEHKPTVEEVEALLRQSLPAYEKAGVCIAVENHDRLPTKVLAGILERIRSPFLGICLDTVNSFGALEGPEVVVENLAPWVVNLHVKDFWIRRANYQIAFASPLTPLLVSGEGKRVLPSPLNGRRAGDEGVVYACPHPLPLSQFRERGSVCSLLPWVEKSRGRRQAKRRVSSGGVQNFERPWRGGCCG
jgi:sugar phosphate isomerase/epimerase